METVKVLLWETIVKESFVRAISRYFVPNYGSADLKWQTKQGFIMTEYIYNCIPEMKNFEGTLEDFVRLLIKEFPNI